MLILTRKVGESVIVGDDVKITVLHAKGSQIRLGIDAPKSVSVHREEIFARIHPKQNELPTSLQQDGSIQAENLCETELPKE